MGIESFAIKRGKSKLCILNMINQLFGLESVYFKNISSCFFF